MKKYSLVIEYDNGVMSIPFEELKDIDEFTMQFDSKGELFRFLDRSLNLGANRKNMSNIYIKHMYTKRNEKHTKQVEKMDIKYSVDDYEEASIIDNYTKYYCDKPGRIYGYGGIRFVNHDAINEYKRGSNNLTDRDIALAVMSYFRKGSYKAYRDAYFLLKKAGYKIKTKPVFKNHIIDRTNLDKYDISDDYMATVASEARLGHIDSGEAMDELSKIDIEELAKNTYNPDYGLFDGMGVTPREEMLDLDRAISLTALSKKSLEELLAMVLQYREEYNKGKKR